MMPVQEPLVSVVTPVYNGEAHLRECVESVLAQTYVHWDYSIVNNCSTDGTLAIATEYAARDPRIRVRTNDTHVRVIASHNIAFRQISPESKYCKVVAADDWILPECLEKMVRLAEAHPSVGIVGAYGCSLNKAGVMWDRVPYPIEVVSGPEMCRSSLRGGPYAFGAPTSVLYRSDIVRSRHAFYNENNLHADKEACIEFLGTHDFGFVHQVLTFMRVRDDSMTSYSEMVNTYLPDELYVYSKYGPKYFGIEELERGIRQRLADYYDYLGEQVYKRRNREFWDFHRGKFASLQHSFSTPRLAAAAAKYALGAARHPIQTATTMSRRLFRALRRT